MPLFLQVDYSISLIFCVGLFFILFFRKLV
nr:MAG TPA: hypothetical protein [Caudoviricetes sp.]